MLDILLTIALAGDYPSLNNYFINDAEEITAPKEQKPKGKMQEREEGKEEENSERDEKQKRIRNHKEISDRVNKEIEKVEKSLSEIRKNPEYQNSEPDSLEPYEKKNSEGANNTTTLKRTNSLPVEPSP